MRFKIFIIFIMLSVLPVLFYAEEDKNKTDNAADGSDVKENKNGDNTTDSGKAKEKKKAQKKDEKRFQFGLGIFGNSDDFSTMSDNFDRIMAIKHGKNYSYPGYNQERMDSIQSMDKWMQNSTLLGYILRKQEYGGDIRILYQYFMSEIDLSFLATDNSNPDLSLAMFSPMIGFRNPKMFMPYLIAGPNFTLKYDTNKLDGQKSWQNKIQDFENTFLFKVGLIAKTGFDLKFERFSIGAYYQYQLNDFDEANYWYIMYKDGDASRGDVFKNLFLANSRIGIALNVYLF